MTFRLSKNFHGVGIGPLSKILAVKTSLHRVKIILKSYLKSYTSLKFNFGRTKKNKSVTNPLSRAGTL